MSDTKATFSSPSYWMPVSQEEREAAISRVPFPEQRQELLSQAGQGAILPTSWLGPTPKTPEIREGVWTGQPDATSLAPGPAPGAP